MLPVSNHSNHSKQSEQSAATTAVYYAPSTRKILNSWKEIANYIGRGVRTAQRYESQFGFPVHRPAGKDRTSVLAFSDELDEWLQRTPVKNHRHVRPVLLVLDIPTQASISSRKLVLEVAKFNVLTALTVEEFYETAEKFEVDGFVVDCPQGDTLAVEICESLNERHSKGPVFAVVPEGAADGNVPRCVDHVVVGSNPQNLLAAVMGVFGPPRLQ
jgi:hypothetical protein